MDNGRRLSSATTNLAFVYLLYRRLGCGQPMLARGGTEEGQAHHGIDKRDSRKTVSKRLGTDGQRVG